MLQLYNINRARAAAYYPTNILVIAIDTKTQHLIQADCLILSVLTKVYFLRTARPSPVIYLAAYSITPEIQVIAWLEIFLRKRSERDGCEKHNQDQ